MDPNSKLFQIQYLLIRLKRDAKTFDDMYFGIDEILYDIENYGDQQ